MIIIHYVIYIYKVARTQMGMGMGMRIKTFSSTQTQREKRSGPELGKCHDPGLMLEFLL